MYKNSNLIFMWKIPSLILLSMAMACKKPVAPSKPDVEIEEPIVKAPDVYVFSDKITWADEFDINGAPNEAIWNYDLGGGGWGNNEKQTYTKNADNVSVKDGMLNITAKFNKDFPFYTSTRMVTKDKRDFLYGKIEIKAKLPKGVGTWPAIWTLATKSSYGDAYWPDNGELDIMEHVGFDQDKVHNNIHTKAFHHSIGTNKGNSRSVANVSDQFHVYSMEWLPTGVSFFIDGEKNFEFKKESFYSWKEWPFDKPQHLILNIAVGGNWGGQKGIDDTVFPQKMEVDYVRYYEAVKK
jgi:beta-glucanase (GH16 family)